MKIVHIDMTGPFTEGMTYQENILPSEQAKLGHEVELWVTTEKYYNGEEVHTPPCNKEITDGVLLRRFDYADYGIGLITKKIREVKNLYKELETSAPSFIMQHDIATKVTNEVCRYVKDHPKVRYVVDIHSDYYNSATSLLSKIFLHRIIYRRYARIAYDTAETMYCISPEAKKFVIENYGLKEDKLKFLPLGATVPSDNEYNEMRNRRRKELGVGDNVTVFIHSGKLTPLKRTRDVLQAMEQIDSESCRLIIIGSADDELTETIKQAEQKDSRIEYLGWKSGEELSEWLCAGDVYVSPGSQSNTVQTAMCRRCAMIVYSYENYVSMGHETVCTVTDCDELTKYMERMAVEDEYRSKMQNNAYKYGGRVLDYRKQAEMVLEATQSR